MRFFFHHFYHSLAWTYDMVAAIVSLGQWNTWVMGVLAHIEGEKVLELGFGPGHLQAELHRRGYRVLGLDESFQMAKKAAHRLHRLNLTPGLVRGRSEALPFADRWCDTVVATFPTDYIYKPQTLKNIGRILKPGGLLVVLPMVWQASGPLERVTDWLFRATGQREDDSALFRAKILAPFEESGFEAEIRLESCKSSTLLIVLARKP